MLIKQLIGAASKGTSILGRTFVLCTMALLPCCLGARRPHAGYRQTSDSAIATRTNSDQHFPLTYLRDFRERSKEQMNI
jgi:hypothetical protein